MSELSMVERVARVLNPEVFDPEVLRVYGDLWAYKEREKALAKARAAIEEMREPSADMIDGAFDTHISLSLNDVNKIWRAMVDAALAEP